MRPEERRRRRAPFVDPRLKLAWREQVILGLLREVAVGRRVRSDPREAVLGSRFDGEAEERGQQQPFTASVVGVFEVAVDAPAGADELDHGPRQLESEERKHEQGRVEPDVGGGQVEVVAEPGGDAGERGGVDAVALLPPVGARMQADSLQMPLDPPGGRSPAVRDPVPSAMAPDRPEPQTPAVVLDERPFAPVALARQRVARVEALEPRDEVEERLCTGCLAPAADRVRDEAPVPQPAVPGRAETSGRLGRRRSALGARGSDRRCAA